MLTLARYEGEAIVLETSDGPIRIVVSELIRWSGRRQAKLCIDAPACVKVSREEPDCEPLQTDID